MRPLAALAVLTMLIMVYMYSTAPCGAEAEKIVLRVTVDGVPLQGVRVALSRYRVSGYPGVVEAENTTDPQGYVVLRATATDNLYVYVRHPVYGVLDLDPSSTYSAGIPLSDVLGKEGGLDIGVYGGYTRISYTLRLNVTDEYLSPLSDVYVLIMYGDTVIEEAIVPGDAVYTPSAVLLDGPGINTDAYRVAVAAGTTSFTARGLPGTVTRIIDAHAPEILWRNASLVFNEKAGYIGIVIRVGYRDGVNTGMVSGEGTVTPVCGGCVNRSYSLAVYREYGGGEDGVLVFRANKLLAEIIRDSGRNHTIHILYNVSLSDPGGHTVALGGVLLFNYTAPPEQGGAEDTGTENIHGDEYVSGHSPPISNTSTSTGPGVILPSRPIGAKEGSPIEIYAAGPVLGVMVLIVELHRRRRGS